MRGAGAGRRNQDYLSISFGIKLFPGRIGEPWDARGIDEPAPVAFRGFPHDNFSGEGLGGGILSMRTALPLFWGADKRPAFEGENETEGGGGDPEGIAQAFIILEGGIASYHLEIGVMVGGPDEADGCMIREDRNGGGVFGKEEDRVWGGWGPIHQEIGIPGPEPEAEIEIEADGRLPGPGGIEREGEAEGRNGFKQIEQEGFADALMAEGGIEIEAGEVKCIEEVGGVIEGDSAYAFVMVEEPVASMKGTVGGRGCIEVGGSGMGEPVMAAGRIDKAGVGIVAEAMASIGGEIAIDKGELFALIGAERGDDAAIEEFLVDALEMGIVYGAHNALLETLLDEDWGAGQDFSSSNSGGISSRRGRRGTLSLSQ